MKNKTKTATKQPAQLLKYLENQNVQHDFLNHKTVYTAIDAANTLKKKMSKIVKSLLVKADQKYFLVCLPADYNLDFKKLKKVIEGNLKEKIKIIQIPSEKEMQKILKVKDASISAFGRVHDLPVVLEKKVAKIKKAVFGSGSFNHSVEMTVKDFIKLEEAILGSFGIKKKIKSSSKAKGKGMSKNKKSKLRRKQLGHKKIYMKKKTTKKKVAPKKKAVAKRKPAAKKKVAKKKPAAKRKPATKKKATKKKPAAKKKVAKKKAAPKRKKK